MHRSLCTKMSFECAAHLWKSYVNATQFRRLFIKTKKSWIVPIKEKTKIIRAPKPWFTENIHRLKRVARKAERLWRKYKQSHQYETMKSARNTYNYELDREKKKTLSEKVVNCKGDSKQLYQFVAELTGAKSDNPMPSENSDSALAENFADYFMNTIDKIRQSLKRLQKLLAYD